MDKYVGRLINAANFRSSLLSFLDSGDAFLVGFIPRILEKLRSLHATVLKLPTYRFYASSLLILYDGAWAEEDMQSTSRYNAENVDRDQSARLPQRTRKDKKKVSHHRKKKASFEEKVVCKYGEGENNVHEDVEGDIVGADAHDGHEDGDDELDEEGMDDFEDEDGDEEEDNLILRSSPRKHEADIRMIDFAQCISNAHQLKSIDDPLTDQEDSEFGESEDDRKDKFYIDEAGEILASKGDVESIMKETDNSARPVKSKSNNKSNYRRKAHSKSIRVSFPPTTKGPDGGYLLGLKTLIKAFEDIWIEHGSNGHVRKSSLVSQEVSTASSNVTNSSTYHDNDNISNAAEYK